MEFRSKLNSSKNRWQNIRNIGVAYILREQGQVFNFNHLSVVYFKNQINLSYLQ